MERKPKYPVLLVHGLGFRDDGQLIKYWGQVPRFFERQGVSVYLCGQDAFGSVASNAVQVKRRIAEVIEQSGAEKVNLMAHSKGGLDCREALMDRACATSVASLITLSTPHHGAKVVERYFEHRSSWVFRSAALVLDFWARLLGDQAPDVLGACASLLPAICEERNRKQVHWEGIFVRSYAASYKTKHFYELYHRSGRWVQDLEGDNDGLVSVRSASWLGFSGILRSPQTAGVSHIAVLGRKGLNYPCALEGEAINTIADFYTLLLRLLAENGC